MEVKNNLHFSEFMSRFKEEIKNELLAFGAELDGIVQTNLIPTTATGNLEGSVDFGSEVQDSSVSLAFGTPVTYGQYVETGTVPHWAPLEPLISWVEDKLQPHVLAIGVSFEGGKAHPTRKGTIKLTGDARQKEILRVAKLIQMKIARVGTQGQWFLKRALESMAIPYELNYNDTGTEYSLDVSSWLAPRMEGIISKATNGLS